MQGRICIVDHDLGNRGFLRECLEKEGHDVSVFDSGIQAKPFIINANFNIIILNCESPGIKEVNFLSEIKKYSHAKILLIVSKRGDPSLREAIESGVYGFIYKPFDPNEVCMMINCLIR